MLISGKYCVYKKGVYPLGLSEGFVHWDDEDRNNVNKDGGSLPEGVYGSDTRIFFCCRTDGDKSDPVPLPLSKPFYLLAYGSSDCQLVKGAITTTEYIIFDNEDKNNQDSSGGVHPYASSNLIYYCYYQGVTKLVFFTVIMVLFAMLFNRQTKQKSSKRAACFLYSDYGVVCYAFQSSDQTEKFETRTLICLLGSDLIYYSSQMREHP